MAAMEPVWKFLHYLEGFEFAAFWISFFTAMTLAGFFLDYLMQKQGFGPYWNALYMTGGVFLGLFVRYNYLDKYRMEFHDPYLTITTILAVTGTMIISMAFLRNRFL